MSVHIAIVKLYSVCNTVYAPYRHNVSNKRYTGRTWNEGDLEQCAEEYWDARERWEQLTKNIS
jgi:hypothetical protein